MTHLITRIGRLGDGIAEGPVYAARTLPGEEIAGDQVGQRIPAPRILQPSPERVAPPCPHYGACGGCALMHASDGFVSAWKAGVVTEALAAHGVAAPIRRVTTSPPQSRRRATFTGRRLKSGPVVGFHARASDTVIDTPGCLLLRPEILAARPACLDIVRVLGSRKGEVRIAVTASRTGIDVDVSGGRRADLPVRGELAAIARRHDLARLSVEGETVAEDRAPLQSFDGIAVHPPPGAFLQATREGEAALRAAVFDAVGDARRIADLFAGCGTFALPLARQTEVRAVEGDAALIAALDRGWRHGTGLKTVSTERRDLFRMPLEPDELARVDAVVIDPPRAGAEAQTRALAAAGVSRIAAVSCNPATFARDARRLCEAGFRIDWIEVVDQFRWSPHVELVASLSRSHGRDR